MCGRDILNENSSNLKFTKSDPYGKEFIVIVGPTEENRACNPNTQINIIQTCGSRTRNSKHNIYCSQLIAFF